MNILTPEQTATRLQVTTETVRRWLRRGEFKAAKTPAGWRITEHDIEAFLAAHHTGYPDSDDDDAYWAAEATAALDRLERGEDSVITLEQWEARHGLGG